MQGQKRLILVLYMLFVLVSIANAGIEKFNNRVQCVTGNNLTVTDDRFVEMMTTGWQSDFLNYKTKNRVMLMVDQTKLGLTPFSCQVTLSISYYTYNYTSPGFFEYHNEIKTFNLDYNSSDDYIDRSIYNFEGAHKIRVDIVDVQTGNPQPLNVYLCGDIEVERYYYLDPAIAVSGLSKYYLTTTNELKLDWNHIEGAESYEVEWLLVNDYDHLDVGGITVTNYNPLLEDRFFDFNSTRVRVDSNSYKIPIIYEHGYLLYRVRPIGKTWLQDPVTLLYNLYEITGEYTGTITSGMHATDFADYYPVIPSNDDKLNWQFTMTFAEDGKCQVKKNYMDGSMRVRQEIGKVTNLDVLTVSEKFYDYNGRPAISALPSPAFSGNTYDAFMGYKPNFNQNATGQGFSKLDFDHSGGILSSMSTNNGSSKYYSNQNPFALSENSYIPSAGNYPFIQTKYTPDNTGRIRSQGGVGSEHQVGLHDTRYFYGTPMQEELDDLFGSEVGYSDFYKKNLVQDPNGQVTLTYLNMEGKTIATGLVGAPPQNLVPVDGIEPRLYDVDLLGHTASTIGIVDHGQNNVIDLTDRSLTMDRSILVSSPGNYYFEYSMDGTSYTSGCEEASVCNDCVYDLEISLVNEDGDEFLLRQIPVGGGTSPLTSNTIGTEGNTCSGVSYNYGDYQAPTPGTWFANITEIGEYHLVKKLKINSNSLANYTNHFIQGLATSPCYETTSEIFTTISSGNSCMETCLQCQQALALYTEHVYDEVNTEELIGYTTLEGEYISISEFESICDPLCNLEESPECESKKIMLLSDMGKDGQYGEVTVGGVSIVGGIIVPPTNPIINPLVFSLSVYNTNNRLKLYSKWQLVNDAHPNPSSWVPLVPNWRHPFNPEEYNFSDNSFSSKCQHYLDDNGDIYKVTLQLNGTIYTPAVVSTSNVTSVVDVNTGITTYWTCPENLLNVEDFLSEWQLSWASSLICYHPEYGFYEYCINNSEAYNFGIQLYKASPENGTDYNASLIYNWCNVSSASNLIDQDFYLYPDPQSFPTPTSVLSDPLFENYSTNSYITFYDNKYNAINGTSVNRFRKEFEEALDNYMLKDPSTPSLGYYTIWEMAWYMSMQTNCAYASNPPSAHYVPPITDPNFNKWWSTFRSLYFSTRQKLMHKSITIYSIYNYFYNGCIGDSPFYPNEDGFHHSPLYTTLIPYMIGPFPWLGYPILDHAQACGCYDAPYYSDKTPRFEESQTQLNVPNTCQTGSSLFYPIVPDPSSMEGLADNMGNLTDLNMYESCHICPNGNDLQYLLGALANDHILFTDQTIPLPQANLSCNYSECTSELQDVIHDFTGTTDNQQIFWTYDATNGDVLSMAFAPEGSIETCKIYFHIVYDPMEHDPIEANTPPSEISDFTSLQCIRPISELPSEFIPYFTSTTMSPYVVNNHFFVNAIIDGTVEPVILEVYSECIDIKNCSFDQICTNSQVGDELFNFFAALQLNHEFFLSNGSSIEIHNDGTIPSSVFPYELYLTSSIINGLEQNMVVPGNANWLWTYNNVTHTASIGQNGYPGSCTFVLTFPTGVSETDIGSFIRMEPDPANVPNGFILYGCLSSNGHTVEIHGESSCFEMGSCSSSLNGNSGIGNTPQISPYSSFLDCGVSNDGILLLADLNNYCSPTNHFPSSATYLGKLGHELEAFCGNIHLEIQNPPAGVTFANILSFETLIPDQAQLVPGGTTNYFTVIGNLSNGNQVNVIGSVIGDCPPIGNCIVIDPCCPPTNEATELMNYLNDYISVNLITTSTSNLTIQGPAISNQDQCNINFANLSALTLPVTPASHYIVQFTAINPLVIVSNGQHAFSLNAHWNNGEVSTIVGSTDCLLDLGTCDHGSSNINVANGDFTTSYAGGPCLSVNTTISNTIGFKSNFKIDAVNNPNFCDREIAFDVNTPTYLQVNFAQAFNLDLSNINNQNNRVWIKTFNLEPFTEYEFSSKIKTFTSQHIIDYVIIDPVTNQGISMFSSHYGVIKDPTPPPSTNYQVPQNDGIVMHNADWQTLIGYFFTGNAQSITIAIIVRDDFTGTTEKGRRFGIDDVVLQKLSCPPPQFVCCPTVVPGGGSIDIPGCQAVIDSLATSDAQWEYNHYVNSLVETFQQEYIAKCMDIYEQFNMMYTETSGLFTLYFYDQAGNLVKTVPPKGVVRISDPEGNEVANPDPLNPGQILDYQTYSARVQAAFDLVEQDRLQGSHLYKTKHSMGSYYKYNSLNQVVAQFMPDHDFFSNNSSNPDPELYMYSTRQWYDQYGRIVLSQNSKQLNEIPETYSYTLYDAQGRPYESGKFIPNVGTLPPFIPNNSGLVYYNSFVHWIQLSGQSREVTRTYYDNPLPSGSVAFNYIGTTQDNLRKRVSSVLYDENEDNDPLTYSNALHYSYDIHGNVKEMIVDIPELQIFSNENRYKDINYKYDLISGSVLQVAYQSGKKDAFYHKYEYDAANRLTNVYTSSDLVTWDQDAEYLYYKHGPLQRAEIGDNKVQGQDYAYTIQGWLKGVNSNTLLAKRDIGKDGFIDPLRLNKDAITSRDALGYSLNYYLNDYSSVNNTIAPIDNFIASTSLATYLYSNSGTAPSLFNGNISSMISSINQYNTGTLNLEIVPYLSAFKYDQLNRLKTSSTYSDINIANNEWGIGFSDNSFATKYSYDYNGNIDTLKRTSAGGISIDNLKYFYPNTSTFMRNTNRLTTVLDPLGNVTGSDIGDQNYGYDELGNLKINQQEGIEEIRWSNTGKVREVLRESACIHPHVCDDLEYKYDAMGNRITKIVKEFGSTSNNGGIDDPARWNYTYYIHDPSGNVMATYSKVGINTGGITPGLYLDEQYIYGSSRLGLKTPTVVTPYNNLPSTQLYSTVKGKKMYELNNHLGNVMTVISDRKIPEMEVASNVNLTSSFNGDDYNVISDYSALIVIDQTHSLPKAISVQTNSFGPSLKYRVYNGDIIELSCWLYCQSLPSGAFVAGIMNGSGTWLTYNGLQANSTLNWEQISHNFTVTNNDPEMYLIIQTYVSNSCSQTWYDDLSIEITRSTNANQQFYAADIKSSQDYYPGGMLMPQRNWPGNSTVNGGYRFGFNGKEKEDEITGSTGSHLDFGAR
ncbi:MAG: hypothetical protein HY951_07155, partial [Bacteroidia bacterium]|nr:hypothetical protein [Bacteroidia bacterium]